MNDTQRIADAFKHLHRAARQFNKAVEWLADNSLIDDDAASRFLADHPDPDLP